MTVVSLQKKKIYLQQWSLPLPDYLVSNIPLDFYARIKTACMTIFTTFINTDPNRIACPTYNELKMYFKLSKCFFLYLRALSVRDKTHSMIRVMTETRTQSFSTCRSLQSTT